MIEESLYRLGEELACIIHNISNNALACPAFLFIMNKPG